MNKDTQVGLSLSGKLGNVASDYLEYAAANDDKKRQCLAFPWDLSGSNNVLSIDLNPNNTTNIASNKAGLEVIEYILFDATLGTADVTVTLPGSSLVTGVAEFRGAPCAVLPFLDARNYSPNTSSKLDIEMADSWPTKGTVYVYGYVDDPNA